MPIGNALPLVSPAVGLVTKLTEGVEQLSVAVGAVHVAVAEVVAVVKFILPGQAVKTGGILSVVQVLDWVTIMLKAQVVVLFLASVAVYVTVVMPIGNALPFVKPVVGCVVKDTEGVEQSSVAVGAVHVAIAVVVPVVKFIVLGQAVKIGGVTSVVQEF